MCALLEESQKNPKGYIWGKAGTKLVCALLSLPAPSKSSFSTDQQRIIQKLFLVGCNGSRTSTIFKQVKILFKSVPFFSDECDSIKAKNKATCLDILGYFFMVRERDGAGSLVENDDKTIYSSVPRLKAFFDWLLKTIVSGSMDAIFPAASREYAPLVEELWNDPTVQATFHRRSELKALPVNAKYFLEMVGDVLRTDYEPSEDDILYAEGVTFSNGLGKSEVAGDVRVVVFCVSLADYGQYSVDGNNILTNKIIQIRSLFESIVTHPTFEHTDFLLDTPLTRCEWFIDFQPIISKNQSNNSRSNKNESTHAELGFYYIAVKFKRLFTSLMFVKDALKIAREVMKWDEEKHSFGFQLSEQSISQYAMKHPL
uniref:Uncharacterized protein n=1 Tax=Kalanchoe fedtschenkoi TaxID=63787 RepID=A0A7N0RIQ2_KALFE